METDFDSFIVGVDDSDVSRRAFEWACRQAGDGTVAAVHAFPPVTSLFAASAMIDLGPVRTQHAELLESEWTRPPLGSTATITATIVDNDAVTALTTAAAERPESIIVIGQHGADLRNDRDHREHHLGHVAANLFRVADQPVVMVNSSARIDLVNEIVVVAVHGPAHANHQPLDFGARLATSRSARLHLVSVAATATDRSGPILTYGFGAVLIDPVAVRDATSDALESLVDELRVDWPDLDVSGTVVTGHPVAALAKSVADVGAAIVVVGNHHHSTLISVVADAVLRHLPARVTCPVAAVPVKPAQ